MATRKRKLDEAEVPAGTEHRSAVSYRTAAERRRRPIDPKRRIARAQGHLRRRTVARRDPKLPSVAHEAPASSGTTKMPDQPRELGSAGEWPPQTVCGGEI